MKKDIIFLSWAQKAFTNYKAVPPGVGHNSSGEFGIPCFSGGQVLN